MEQKSDRRMKRGRRPNGEPNAVDVYVGERLRLRRQMLNLSQEKLAEALGLTFQQVQKYEKGANRISCSRLWDFSQVLQVPVQYFFMDMPEQTALDSPRFVQGGQSKKLIFEPSSQIYDTKTLQMVCSFQKINNQKVAKYLHGLINELGKSTYMSEKQAENP